MFLFSCSVLFIFLGHFFKAFRQKIFYQVYQDIDISILTKGLSVGYFINLFLPFRIGDVFRAIYIGKNQQGTGIAFSLATVIWDRLFDVISVGFFFCILNLYNPNDVLFLQNIKFYLIFSLILLLLLIIFTIFNKQIKIFMYYISSIFNKHIQLNIMLFFWSLITSFKDGKKYINFKNIILNSILMWSSYLFSYYLFSKFISKYIHYFKFSDVLYIFFSQSSFDSSSWTAISNYSNLDVILMIYLVIPIIVLFIYPRKKNNITSESISFNNDEQNFTLLLPQVDKNAQITFLTSYFSDNDKAYIKNFLEINKNIVILEDFSAGSNATTMLCVKENITFFRKYLFGEECKNLKKQYDFIINFKDVLPLPNILYSKVDDKFFYYDMEYSYDAVNLFKYIHSNPIEKSFVIIKDVVKLLQNTIHNETTINNNHKLDLNLYINEKVIKNINLIKNHKLIKDIYQYDTININGISYSNFKVYEHIFNGEALKSIFNHDPIAIIHGDLTIENIICKISSNDNSEFYLIDPNQGNPFNSIYLDYAKLLQSLHGGYEFFMHTKLVQVDKNNVYFSDMVSSNYMDLFKLYKKYLDENFEYYEVKSIFYHEIIHWLRLMPYKLKKDGKRSLLFYCAMMIVINDIIDWFD